MVEDIKCPQCCINGKYNAVKGCILCGGVGVKPPKLTYDGVLDMIDEFTKYWPSTEYGPGHIVLSDYNLDGASIQWCLQQVDTPDRVYNLTDREMEMTSRVLNQLLIILDMIQEDDE